MFQMYDANHDPNKDTAVPLFRVEGVLNKSATKLNGDVPVYEQVEYVKILIPGSKDEVDRPVEKRDIERWPAQYAKFKAGQEQVPDGLPLSEFSTASEVERAMMRGAGIRTVEQMAEYPDGSLSRIGIGATRLKQKAQAFLRARGQLTEVLKLQQQVDELKAELEKLRAKNGNDASADLSGRAEGDGVQPAVADHRKQRAGRPDAVLTGGARG